MEGASLEGGAAAKPYSPRRRQQSKMWPDSEFWLIVYLGACDQKMCSNTKFWLIAYFGARDTKMYSKSESWLSASCLPRARLSRMVRERGNIRHEDGKLHIFQAYINSRSPVGTPPLPLLLLLAAAASDAYASSAERLTTAGRPTRKSS